jgi:hypothetical protein
MSNTLHMRRIRNPRQTLGVLTVRDGDEQVWQCVTSELPWRDNLRRQSCIPDGQYQVLHRSAGRSRMLDYPHLWLPNVPSRSHILIHAGNYVADSAGCILVGDELVDWDADHVTEITDSRRTLEILVGLVPRDGTILTIKTMEQRMHVLPTQAAHA